MNNPVIRIRNVKKSFCSGTLNIQVLKDINLTVQAGERISIVGTSGCGKSTLLNLMGGLESVDSGLLEVNGLTVSDLEERELTEYRTRGIGFVFQFHYLLKDFTALENVMLPSLMAGVSRIRARKHAADMLSRVRVTGRSGHYPSELSGGERQRVALARALVNNPPLVLADEPTGNLDEAHKEAVRDTLFSLCLEEGTTLILVTHSRQLADQADRCFMLAEGQLHPA